MHSIRAFAVFLGVLLAVTAAGSPPLEDESIEEDPDEAQGINGIVTLSDGTTLRGKVSFTAGKRLRIYDLRRRRVDYLDLEQIGVIRTFVEEEKLEEAWAFEEEGSPKKIKLGWRYPLRTYQQEVQLVGGQVIVGHCYAAVLFVDDGSREHKVILPRVQRGKQGQKLEDLIYPRGVVLSEPSPETIVGKPKASSFASVEGELSRLSALALIELRSLGGYPGAVSRNGEFHVSGLLPGAHAAFLRRGDEVIVGFPSETVLPDTDRSAIEKRVSSLAEFFEEKRIVFVGGDPERPLLLLELRRRGETTLPTARGGSARVLRWELWGLERQGESWRIRRRVFLDRMLLDGPRDPSIRYRREPRLWQIELKPGKNHLPRAESPAAN